MDFSSILYSLWYLSIKTLFSDYLHHFQPSGNGRWCWHRVLPWPQPLWGISKLQFYQAEFYSSSPEKGVFILSITLLKAEGG